MADAAYVARTPFGQALSRELATALLSRVPDPAGTWLQQVVADSVADPDALLNRFDVSSLRLRANSRGFFLTGTVVGDEELAVGWEGLPIELLFAPGPDDDSFEFSFAIDVDFVARTFDLYLDIAIGLRFGAALLSLVDSTGQRTGEPVTVRLLGRGFVDEAFNIDVIPLDTIDLPECMIGDTGLIISVSGIEPSLNGGNFRIGELVIKLPKDFEFPVLDELRVKNAVIGSAGFSGDVAAIWDLKFEATQASGPTAGLVWGAPGTFFWSLSFLVRGP